jgi:DNA-binding NarL/FixJ family response regulator
MRISERTRAGDGRTLILDEQRASAPSIETLRSLGLTDRQAQVLRLVARGKRSRQIAAELSISVATVEKHLEHIYSRLGVSSRAEAIACVYG